MSNGTRFVIHGLAQRPDGRLGLIAEYRVKVDGGSKVLLRDWTGDSWANTRRESKVAAAFVARLNSGSVVLA